MKGDKKTMSKYKVNYTSKAGKKTVKKLSARTGDNAYLVVKHNLGGRNIKVKKLLR